MKLQISDHGRAEIFTNLFQHIKLFTDYINITFDKEKMYSFKNYINLEKYKVIQWLDNLK